MLALVLPPAIDMAMMKQEQCFSARRVTLNALLLVVGCVGVFGGAGAAVLELAGVNLVHIGP